MSYQVLARKWRPQKFIDVVGQQHVLTALANSLELGRLHHAYLFSGTRGVGKTSIARLLAKGLNCEKAVTATPCGQCGNCLEIEQGRFVDLIEIDAASRTKVEDTRDLLDNVQYAPARGRYKIYLIDEVHMLSRHSFNALLKTLEEPPPHVKFLLATTDPQKLPITVLSRCLHFHLRALEHGLIQAQLEKILNAEEITVEVRALQLIAKAADGSMRDALSLTDQAIAMGSGQITTTSVTQMLGTLDDEQPLALAEALIAADAVSIMTQIENASFNGVDWDNLLAETLSVFHRVAMIQLLPVSGENQQHEQRLKALARKLSPQELQLYYQTLLVGRKELMFAPDRKMGVEMTLLRALAFHPKSVAVERESRFSALSTAEQSLVHPTISQSVYSKHQDLSLLPEKPVPDKPVAAHSSLPELQVTLPDTTAQLLKARQQLLAHHSAMQEKKKSTKATAEIVKERLSPLERFVNASENRHKKTATLAERVNKEEPYQWKAQNINIVAEKQNATPKEIRSALEFEKTPELALKLAEESAKRDEWAKEIAALTLPKLVQQLALNAFKTSIDNNKIYLHLRSSQRHLNTSTAQKVLMDALSSKANQPIELSIIEDDNYAIKTPIEWRQAIYEEKLICAKTSIVADKNVKSICSLFDAELDEGSIRPV